MTLARPLPPGTAASDLGRGPGLAQRLAAPALRGAVLFWFAVTVAGQLMFAAYVALFYGGAAARGQFAEWNKVLPHGFVAGDTPGNAVVASHLLFTVVVVLGGALQLWPALRQRAPAVHRWNGRLYLLSAAVLAVGGLVMVWTRGAVGALPQHIAISLNAVLIGACAALALHHALARRFDAHRRWALRLFLAVSGVWFFRVGLMAWLMIHRRPVGFDPETFTGPFLIALTFSQYLLPLALLELYFIAQRSPRPAARLGMAATLVAFTLLAALGIAGASMMMWLPRM